MSKQLIYLTSFVLLLSMAGDGWPKASAPAPHDGAIHEATWVSFSWWSAPIFSTSCYESISHLFSLS